MENTEAIIENESFFLQVLENLKENAIMIYPYGESRVSFQKIDGKFSGDHENYSRVKELVSPEFLQENFKLKNI